jgi:lipid-A-disaccharide synthase-like uncharacterized protein
VTGPARTALAAAVLIAVLAGSVAADDPSPQPGSERLSIRLKPLPPGVRKVWLETDERGAPRYVVLRTDGSYQRLRPDELARALRDDARDRSWLFRLLNITSPVGFAWVALGLAGQVLFTGRMVLQWLISEREKRSVVPVGFWWMSLLGATMLLVYFTWRRDLVGVLGQSTGWVIYVRNLWLIYRG